MWQSKWAPKPDEAAPQLPSNPEKPPATSPPPALSRTTTNELRPTTSLSAAAPTFSPASPAPPPPDVSTEDDFAQTGAAQEDLFSDVVPVDESMRVRSDDDLFADDFTPVAQPVVEQQPSPAPAPTHGPPPKGDGLRERGRGGRGRGRGGGASKQGPIDPGQNKPSTDREAVEPPENAPTGPRKESIPSVRGDRRATGGVKKPKLTEDELAEKMARIKLKNAELNAAHERAEADAASFAHRESQAKQEAAEKAKAERRDRQQMMGERERNRARKLKAMEGREWDLDKQQEDFERGGRYDKRGGFAGDQRDYTDGREYLYREPRGGRGGARGARDGRPTERSAPPKPEEFPALPESGKPGLERFESGHAGRSWADQVEGAT